VTNGTLHRNRLLVSGVAAGRSRILRSSTGEATEQAGPGIPVQVIGWKQLPEVGALVEQVPDETTQKHIIDTRLREATMRAMNISTNKDTDADEIKTIDLIVKADVSGSVEAIVPALLGLSTPKTVVKVIHASVGDVTESDASLAAASKARIICFNSKIGSRVAEVILEKAEMQVIESPIIYTILDDVKRIIRKTEYSEEEHWEVTASAEVLQVITIADRKAIAGCVVKLGTISRSGMFRVMRNQEQIHEGMSGLLPFPFSLLKGYRTACKSQALQERCKCHEEGR